MTTIPCLGLAPIITFSSCAKTESAKKIDGSNWNGVASGCYFDVSEYDLDEAQGTVTYKSSAFIKGENIVMPNYVEANGVTYKVYLAPRCFEGNGAIIGSFECNDFIDSIPGLCFYQAWSLTSIIMHNYPKSIGEQAFAQTGLQHFYIKQLDQLNEDWTLNLESIGDKAFQSLSLMTGNLFFSSKFKKLGAYAFDHCSGLTGLDFRFCKSLKQIPDSAFLACALIKKLVLPPELEKIGDNAFNGCSLLVYIDLPKDGMRFELGKGSFYDCGQLINFTRKCEITLMGDQCFAKDPSLSPDFMAWSITKLETIPQAAFENTNFSIVTFYPGYPSEVLDGAFGECSNLSKIDFSHFTSQEPPTWSGIDIFRDTQQRGIIMLPHGANMLRWQQLFYTKTEFGEFIPIQGIILDDEHWKMMVA